MKAISLTREELELLNEMLDDTYTSEETRSIQEKIHQALLETMPELVTKNEFIDAVRDADVSFDEIGFFFSVASDTMLPNVRMFLYNKGARMKLPVWTNLALASIEALLLTHLSDSVQKGSFNTAELVDCFDLDFLLYTATNNISLTDVSRCLDPLESSRGSMLAMTDYTFKVRKV